MNAICKKVFPEETKLDLEYLNALKEEICALNHNIGIAAAMPNSDRKKQLLDVMQSVKKSLQEVRHKGVNDILLVHLPVLYLQINKLKKEQK